MPYAELLKLLDIAPYGAPRRNILRLAALGLKVDCGEATPGSWRPIWSTRDR